MFLLGEADVADAMVSSMDPRAGVERMVALSLKFASGAIGSVIGDFHSGRVADRFCVYGNGGSIVAENLESGEFELSSNGQTEKLTFDRLPAPHFGLIEHIEQVLLDGSPNESSGADGLITETILDAGVRQGFAWYNPA